MHQHALFRNKKKQKKTKIFWRGGYAPPQTTGEGHRPLPRPHPPLWRLRASAPSTAFLTNRTLLHGAASGNLKLQCVATFLLLYVVYVYIAVAGLPGPPGDTGATGLRGPPGFRGRTGVPGGPGVQGGTGPENIDPNGPKGPSGDTGWTGVRGNNGTVILTNNTRHRPTATRSSFNMMAAQRAMLQTCS